MESQEAKQVISALNAQTKALEQIVQKLDRLVEFQFLQLAPDQKKALQESDLAKASRTSKSS